MSANIQGWQQAKKLFGVHGQKPADFHESLQGCSELIFVSMARGTTQMGPGLRSIAKARSGKAPSEASDRGTGYCEESMVIVFELSVTPGCEVIERSKYRDLKIGNSAERSEGPGHEILLRGFSMPTVQRPNITVPQYQSTTKS